MELKFGDLQAWNPRLQRFNRTFMELKLSGLTFPDRSMDVLIVPLWN